ncbi:MAG: AIR carboxylase family protein, partial [Candidatus Neomarinimicrobiota bacterium]
MTDKPRAKAVLILGSKSDEGHAKKITDKLKKQGVHYDQHIASAHKQPRKVLDIIETYEPETAIVFVTIAGRSNALSGFVAASSRFPTIACPPFKDKIDMMVNIHS